MVLIRPLISNSSNSLSEFWGIVLGALITIGTTFTIIFYSFFSSLASTFSLFVFFRFFLCSLLERRGPLFGFFFVTITRLSLLAGIRWFISILKSQRFLCLILLDGICLVVWSNFSFLHNSLWITFPTHSCSLFALVCFIMITINNNIIFNICFLINLFIFLIFHLIFLPLSFFPIPAYLFFFLFLFSFIALGFFSSIYNCTVQSAWPQNTLTVSL